MTSLHCTPLQRFLRNRRSVASLPSMEQTASDLLTSGAAKPLNAAATIAAWKELAPDLLMLDINVPDFSSTEACR